MPQVKYLGYADHLIMPGKDKPIAKGDTVTIAQNVLDDLLLRGHTFEGAEVEVVRLPAPHEVPDMPPAKGNDLTRAAALRRVQSGGRMVVAAVDVDPPSVGEETAAKTAKSSK